MKSTRKKDIRFGKHNLLSDDEFNPENGKERITLYIDQQVADAFRDHAELTGQKYQTLIRESLRKLVFENTDEDLGERVSKLEKAIFKKQA